jgi:Lon protease-like protein
MQNIELPEKIAVMVLSDCNLFPQGMLPLYIFEQRYRNMLSNALVSSRMLCIGTVDPVAMDGERVDGVPPIFPYSTAGFLRACVGNADGTSNLILQGICRIRLTDWDMSGDYLQARPEKIVTKVDCEKTVEALGLKLARILDRLNEGGMGMSEQARLHLQNLSDKPEDLADFAAYNMIPNAYSRQVLLGEESLEKRLEFVIKKLMRQESEFVKSEEA